mgnify:CR=1 FL=1
MYPPRTSYSYIPLLMPILSRFLKGFLGKSGSDWMMKTFLDLEQKEVGLTCQHEIPLLEVK